jgi:hypothetical protein
MKVRTDFVSFTRRKSMTLGAAGFEEGSTLAGVTYNRY